MNHIAAGRRTRTLAWPRRLASLATTGNGLCVLAGLYFSLVGSVAFWRAVAGAGALHGWDGARLALSLAVAIVAVNVWLMGLLLHGRLARPVLSLLLVTTAAASHFALRYSVHLDDGMLRNILQTDWKEGSELLTPALLRDVGLLGVLPGVLAWRLPLRVEPLRRAGWQRLKLLAGALLLALAAVLSSFHGVAGLMHAHREARHLLAPANYLVSLVRVAAKDGAGRRARSPVGAHAHVVGRPAGTRPRVLVLVVGETVRAQDWGLDGYARDTTPRLRGLDVVNFGDVTACGSSTEVSLPCMFAAVGRRDYDRGRIEGSESLLHVLAHAGIATLWRDNQTGCKGVCAGLAYESFEHGGDPAWCDASGCADEAMLAGLRQRIEGERGDLVVVLHQLGNHGPAYYRRYPASLRRFLPACETVELGDCTQEEVVNAYDNAVLHTDAFVAATIGLLQGIDDRDTALLYVSDHGESLGENGLYLHGLPYAIAPETQTKVPMVAWLSPSMATSRGVDMACLRDRATRPASHDNLFHSVLGLLQVATPEYERGLDVFAGCTPGKGVQRRSPASAGLVSKGLPQASTSSLYASTGMHAHMTFLSP